MAIKIGNKVRFLNESGEGIVTRFKDKETAFVEVDGFEIPYNIKSLVLINTEVVFTEEEKEGDEVKSESVFFVVEPDHELLLLQNEFSFYLLNSSSFNLLYTYCIKDGNQYQTIKQGELGASQKLLLKKIQKHQLKEFAYHKIELLFFKKHHHTAQIPAAEIIHVSDTILKRNDCIPHHDFKFPIWAFTLKDHFIEAKKVEQKLTDYDIERLRKIKEAAPSEKRSIPHNNPAFMIEKEIDLHAENLLGSFKHMSNHEILQVQLKHFQKNLEEAIANHYYKIVFIHGVGNGRLKQEIHTILKNYSKEVSVKDGSYKKYGYGATEVLIL
ncbi:MAG TPA: DUF2027 domain-containing protein [Bacteroidia bacterium]|nr:DUF2027 domain-containing protein [Bacteroidia bacterium]